jgi:nitrate/nitrite transporter NarK
LAAASFFGAHVFVAIPVALVPATGYQNLLMWFSAGCCRLSSQGVGFVSRWFAMEKQGSALGVYGLGNIGQSAAVFLGPIVAAAMAFAAYWGWRSFSWCGRWCLRCWAKCRDRRFVRVWKNVGRAAREPLAWALAGFFF